MLIKSKLFKTEIISGGEIEYKYISSHNKDSPTIVFLHEGLGSISTWKTFPTLVAEATNCSVFVYSRHGYGGSSFTKRKFDKSYMHHEALEILPAILDNFEIKRPILYGHSDGASIALIHAGAMDTEVSAIIAEAPHVFVENISIEGIRTAKSAFEVGNLKNSLTKHHANPDKTFQNWSNAWLNPKFLRWEIKDYLKNIHCPLLLIQGTEDAYGTLKQLESIEENVNGSFKKLVLEKTGHSPHKEASRQVLLAIKNFISQL